MKRALCLFALLFTIICSHPAIIRAQENNPEQTNIEKLNLESVKKNTENSSSSHKDSENISKQDNIFEGNAMHPMLELDVSETLQWQSNTSTTEHPRMANLEYENRSDIDFYYSKEYIHRAKSVINSISNAQSKILDYLPREYVTNIAVYLLPNINAYFTAIESRGRAPEWAAGLALLHEGVILIRLAPSVAAPVEPERTLAHELNHIALRRYTQGHFVPHWLYEGFAILATEPWGQERANALTHAAMTHSLLSLDDITTHFPAQGATVELAYAQSGHFVSWLVKTYGKETFQNWLQLIANNTPYDLAFEQTFGDSLKFAENQWLKGFENSNASWLAPLMSPEALFFFVGLLAAIGLIIVRNRRRKQKHTPKYPSKTILPKNLRNFGPFK